MRPNIHHILAAALILAVCQAATDRAEAKVVRDGKGAPANPAVDAGGLRLKNEPAPILPYSLIGAIATQDQLIGSCSIAPWRSFTSFPTHRHGLRARVGFRRFIDRPFSRFPVPVR